MVVWKSREQITESLRYTTLHLMCLDGDAMVMPWTESELCLLRRSYVTEMYTVLFARIVIMRLDRGGIQHNKNCL